MKKLRVLVLFGGRSAEHEISLISAANVLRHLDPKKYEAVPVYIDRRGRWLLQDRARLMHGHELKPALADSREVLLDTERALVPTRSGARNSSIDVVFPVLHGPFGEDGTVQGLLELADLPYVGCGVLASAVGMDKEISYRLAAGAGIPVPAFFTLTRGRWKKETARVNAQAARLGYPVFVKPARLGSSVGISKVAGKGGLARAMEVAFLYDDKVIVEKGIQAREIECAVLGDAEDAQVSLPGEVVTSQKHDFYSYSAKYLDPQGAALKIPAALTKAQTKTVQDLALRAFKTLDCYGLSRVDFLMDKRTGRFYFGEVNTLPGFTPHSLYPQLFQASGLSFPKLLDRLVQLARDRHQRRRSLRVKPQ